jgi:hypothetical protein
MTKQTLGSIASELQLKTPDSNDPREIQRATEREYLDNLEWCVKHALKKVDCYSIKGHDECRKRDALDGDFFVTSIIKKEKLLHNVIRNYFIPTKDCPTPSYDQTLYRYNHKKDQLEFIWVIPDRDTCETLHENKDIVVPEERGLLQFILDFYDGTLLRKCKKFNGESKYAGALLEKML